MSTVPPCWSAAVGWANETVGDRAQWMCTLGAHAKSQEGRLIASQKCPLPGTYAIAKK